MSIGDKKSMTKKKWLELQKQYRGTNGFNTGIRTHKSKKHPNRLDRKAQERKEVDNYD